MLKFLPEHVTSSVALSMLIVQSLFHSLVLSLQKIRSCEDHDAHKPVSVWIRGRRGVLPELLLFCGASLSARHGKFRVY